MSRSNLFSISIENGWNWFKFLLNHRNGWHFVLYIYVTFLVSYHAESVTNIRNLKNLPIFAKERWHNMTSFISFCGWTNERASLSTRRNFVVCVINSRKFQFGTLHVWMKYYWREIMLKKVDFSQYYCENLQKVYFFKSVCYQCSHRKELYTLWIYGAKVPNDIIKIRWWFWINFSHSIELK